MKTIVFTLIFLCSSLASANHKTLHLGVSFAISGVIYKVLRDEKYSKKEAALTAIHTTMMLGTFKEIFDNTQPNNKFDLDDMKYNAIGAIAAPLFIMSF